MAVILGNSAVSTVVRTRPRAIRLAMITMRKSIHGFAFLSYMGMGLRLAAPRIAIVCDSGSGIIYLSKIDITKDGLESVPLIL